MITSLLISADDRTPQLSTRASNKPSRRLKFYIHGEGPYYATFSLLVKSALSHLRIYANQRACPLWFPDFTSTYSQLTPADWQLSVLNVEPGEGSVIVQLQSSRRFVWSSTQHSTAQCPGAADISRDEAVIGLLHTSHHAQHIFSFLHPPHGSSASLRTFRIVWAKNTQQKYNM